MHSEETRKKIGDALRKQVDFVCDYCGGIGKTKPSAYKRKKRHFCSMWCYSQFRKYCLPKDEQHAYKGGGELEEIRVIKRKARSYLNHAVRDGRITREPCELCGDSKSEAHHDDYTKPLDVRWFCLKHHRIHENPELLK